jgi:hypothetical protein
MSGSVRHDALSVITVQVGDVSHMDEELDAAEERMRRLALERGDCGILVTRHTHCTFTVALSRDVAFGVTREVRAF